jgi:hypothetical protein
MNKLFISSFLGIALMVPLYASAQVSVVTDTKTAVSASVAIPTAAQIFTSCSQTTIEVRDAAITKARIAYNAAMTAALTARTDGEKAAVAIEDEDEKKAAIQVTADAYKKAVTEAQETLTAARKESWEAFEANAKECQNYKKEAVQPANAKKAAVKSEVKKEAVSLMASTEINQKQADGKTFSQTLREKISSIKVFFGGQAEVTGVSQ